MGRGTISGETGDGLYSLDLDYGAAELQAAIDDATARSAALDDAINGALTKKLYASNAIATQKGIVNAAINAYRDAIAADDGVDDARAAVDAANIELLKLSVPLRVATAEHQNLVNEKAAAESRIAYLSGFNLTSTAAAWCADYTTEATGEVATIEVPGEPKATLIAPLSWDGHESPPQYDAATDGIVTARVVQSASQSYWNIAALPAWQKWKPTYRFAVIDSIDRAANTCDLTLEAATSTAQGLGINKEDTLSGVTFEYMTCDNRAFVVGDDVLVKFNGQSWDSPKVIGFKSHPKSCGLGRLRHHEFFYNDQPGHPYQGSFTTHGYFILDDMGLRDQFRLVPADPAVGGITIERRVNPIDYDPWEVVPIYAYNLLGEPPMVIGWVLDIAVDDQPFYQFIDGAWVQTGTLSHTEVFSIRVRDVWLPYTLNPPVPYPPSHRDMVLTYQDPQQWPLRIEVIASHIGGWGWPDAPSAALIPPGQIQEFRIRVGDDVKFLIAIEPNNSGYFNVQKFDIMTQQEKIDAGMSTGDNLFDPSDPHVEMEGYKFKLDPLPA